MNDANTIINGSESENSAKLCFENAAQDCGPSFGIPPLGGAPYEPPEGGTPNLNPILGRLLTAEQQEQAIGQQNEKRRRTRELLGTDWSPASLGQYRSIQVNTGQYRSIQVNTGQYRSIQVNTG